VLSFGVTISNVDYTDYKLANTEWSLLESYGFGSIERIFQKINWYDTEERKELLDYLFAARLAVFTFVDWVDRTYVENSWISSLAAAFGVNIRLADLVNQVFDISGFVLSSIRDELNKAWEGVKSAGEFISNFAVDLIFQGISQGLNSFSFAIGKIMQLFMTDLGVEMNDFTRFILPESEIEIGLMKNDTDLILKTGIFDLSIFKFFEGVLDNIEINGNELTHAGFGGGVNPPPIPSLDFHPYFADVDWTYVFMVLAKEMILTLAFTIWQALYVAQKKLLAMASYISMLTASFITSNLIAKKIKEDTSLSYDQKVATIHAIFDIHLDFAICTSIDTIIEILTRLKNNWLGKNVEKINAGLVVASTLLLEFVRWDLFELLSGYNGHSFPQSPISQIASVLINSLLAVIGGKQSSFLFGDGLSVLTNITEILAIIMIPGVKSFKDLNELFRTLDFANQGKVPTPFTFGFDIVLYGGLLSIYHGLLTFKWARYANFL
jgi:hypothetical protein